MAQSNTNSFASEASAVAPSAVSGHSDSLYGCEHLQRLAAGNQQDFHSIVERYSKACKEVKSAGLDLELSFRCLQCSHTGEPKDQDSHADETGHQYSAESASMCVFCHACKDFVYDSTLERVRKYGATEPTTKKRKAGEDEDVESFLKSNSTKRLCSTTSIRGLYNLGQTCYQNVIIQSLLHSPLLTSYFLGDSHKAHKCDQTLCVGCAVSEVFSECHNAEENKGYGATGMLLPTWQNSQSLSGYKQQDAHEFFHFLVDRLHQSTLNGQEENCHCFFCKAFGGKLRSTLTCDKCKKSTKKDDPMVDLSLNMQIEALETSKSAANVDLEGCLRAYIAAGKLDDYKCPTCGGTLQQVTKTLKLRKLPAILCMQLKRFEHLTSAEKVEGKLDFPMEINMRPYTTKPKSERVSNYLYDLQSAIIHIGKIDTGHYITYCRQGNQWFLFDDDKITLATEADVLGADAYLLFYSLRSLVREQPRRKKETQETVTIDD